MRIDFPGGWAGDKADKFLASGRSEQENEAFDYMRKLLQWRKTKAVFKDGRLTHFVPADGVYVYFRTKDSERVMVVMNCNDEGKSLALGRFSECLQGVSKLREVTNNVELPYAQEISVAPWTAMVFELLP